MEAVLDNPEAVPAVDDSEKVNQRDCEEAVEFVVRQVLERGATLFDG